MLWLLVSIPDKLANLANLLNNEGMHARDEIVFYKESNGSIPLIEWLDGLSRQRAKAKSIALIKLLALYGYELHRPHSDALRDGIRELRTRVDRINYRLLYFFHGQNCVIISHGITKEGEVPDKEIDQAIVNRAKYQLNPQEHGYFETEQYYEKKTPKIKKISNGLEILERRYIRNNPQMEKLVQQEFEKLQIAQQIYDLRQEAGLSQEELACLIGTKGSVISRLEDAEYRGHSLKILERIAIALGKRIELRIVDRKGKRQVS